MHPSRIFKSSDDLKKAWNEYKQHRIDDAKNWPKVQYVGKRVKEWKTIQFYH